MPDAARIADPIEHTNAMTGLLLGIAAGAVVGALVVGTGGGALVLAAGIAGGVAAGGGVGEVVGSLSAIGNVETGSILSGSSNVLINGLKAARCFDDAGDKADCDGEPPFFWPRHDVGFVAQGSKTVSINGQPAARVGDLIQCSAKISEGSSTVTIGGDPVTTVAIDGEVPAWIDDSLLVLGVGSAVVLAGPVVAVLGLAGSVAGGYAGTWIGGKQFGEGSDGQKLMGLAGSFLGGALGAKAAVKPATLLGNRIRGPVGDFVRTGAQGLGGKARTLAEERAAEVRKMSIRQQNKRVATSAQVDRTTGKSWVETSGNTPESPRPSPADVHPDLKSRYPPGSQSGEKWTIENCAEFKAINKALRDGAKRENLDGSTIHSETGEPMPRCANCQQTSQGTRVSTDNPKWGYPGSVVAGSSNPNDGPEPEE